MDIMITSKNKENFWADKYVLSIGTGERCSFKLDTPYDVLLSIRYDFYTKSYSVFNPLSNQKALFCGKPFSRLELGRFNKLYFKNSDEFLIIRILDRKTMPVIEPAVTTLKEVMI